jgi:hypothetical protein
MAFPHLEIPLLFLLFSLPKDGTIEYLSTSIGSFESVPRKLNLRPLGLRPVSGGVGIWNISVDNLILYSERLVHNLNIRYGLRDLLQAPEEHATTLSIQRVAESMPAQLPARKNCVRLPARGVLPSIGTVGEVGVSFSLFFLPPPLCFFDYTYICGPLWPTTPLFCPKSHILAFLC